MTPLTPASADQERVLDPEEVPPGQKPPTFLEFRPGDELRITVRGGEEQVGFYQHGGVEGLILHDGRNEIQISPEAIRSIHVRGRATKRGAAIGTLVGGLGGGLLGALYTRMDQGFCEYDCSDRSTGAGALLGVAVGAASGVLVGAGVGALLPRWHLRHESRETESSPQAGDVTVIPLTPRAATQIERRRSGFGSAGIQLGYARSLGTGTAAGSVGVTGDLLLSIHRMLHCGPTFGYNDLGGQEHAWHLCGRLQIGDFLGGDRYFGAFGLGLYVWQYAVVTPVTFEDQTYEIEYLLKPSFPGYSVGGGFVLPVDWSSKVLSVEGHWHRGFTPVQSNDRHFSLLTITASLRFCP
jgi:hypothetical protein